VIYTLTLTNYIIDQEQAYNELRRMLSATELLAEQLGLSQQPQPNALPEDSSAGALPEDNRAGALPGDSIAGALPVDSRARKRSLSPVIKRNRGRKLSPMSNDFKKTLHVRNHLSIIWFNLTADLTRFF